jgi:hypothetical protein
MGSRYVLDMLFFLLVREPSESCQRAVSEPPESRQRAAREPSESRQRAARELPESRQRAARELSAAMDTQAAAACPGAPQAPSPLGGPTQTL